MASPDPSEEPTAAVRRLRSLGLLFLGAVALVVTAPLVLPLALVVDLVTAPRRLPTTRAWAFALAYVGAEVVGVTQAGALWLRRRLGLLRGEEAWSQAHRSLQEWWLGALSTAARRLLDLRIEATGDPVPAPVVVLGRHVSLVDSLVSAHLLGVQRHMELRFVLKRELRSDPCLDIVGHRLRNHFVDRAAGPDAPAEIAAVGRLGRDLGPDTAVVLFPEGTRFNPAKRERALARLEARGDVDLHRRASGLRHLLPPRPGGALAVLSEATEVDVAVLGHVGFEGLDDFGGLWRAIPFRRPVVVRAWSHPRASIPDDDDARVRWLFDRWAEMDEWVDAELAARHDADDR